MTMQAVRFDLSSKKLSLEKVEIPRNPLPDEVIIKVAYAGICGTDLHIIDVSTIEPRVLRFEIFYLIE